MYNMNTPGITVFARVLDLISQNMKDTYKIYLV